MVSCSVSMMVRFWMGFVSLEVDMETYLRVEEYKGFGWCVLISGGVLFVARLLRFGKGVLVVSGSRKLLASVGWIVYIGLLGVFCVEEEKIEEEGEEEEQVNGELVGGEEQRDRHC
ncbi:hypothetical protein Tco_0938912 [Tanacetum coccineum]|uniref:Transmembrane protein n=1 Tax=Tanacetum coccineum TaxID=301880 RepID=A0ABQ5DL00_9ASTR